MNLSCQCKYVQVQVSEKNYQTIYFRKWSINFEYTILAYSVLTFFQRCVGIVQIAHIELLHILCSN